jgi:hypothetical protein
MKTSTLTVTILLVFFVASVILAPPDIISQIALMIVMLVVCGVLAFIVSRFKSFGQTPESIKKLIVVLVCLLSITIPCSITSIPGDMDWSPGSSSVSSSVSFTFGNLWIVRLSDHGGFWSKRTECVVCSANSPTTWGYGGSICTLTFSDGNSVKVTLKRNETLWIDKEHKVTSLGPVLDGEDVSLLGNCRYDENLKISSPDELLALVKKLKAEQATSTAPPEAAI